MTNPIERIPNQLEIASFVSNNIHSHEKLPLFNVFDDIIKKGPLFCYIIDFLIKTVEL